jgi:hypothetical protein
MKGNCHARSLIYRSGYGQINEEPYRPFRFLKGKLYWFHRCLLLGLWPNFSEGRALQQQQFLFYAEAPTVACEGMIRSENTVAWHDDGNRIVMVRLPYGAKRPIRRAMSA